MSLTTRTFVSIGSQRITLRVVFAAVVGITLVAVAMAAPTLAQDAVNTEPPKAEPAKPDSAEAPATQAQQPSERQRRRDRREKSEADKPVANAAASGEAAAESTTSAASEVECRSFAVTGSRSRRRVCATPEEWAAADANGEEGVREMRRVGTEQSTIGPGCGVGSPC